MSGLIDRLAGSPGNFPDLTLGQVLEIHARLGFRAFELFTGWARSAVDIDAPPSGVRRALDNHDMRETLRAIGDRRMAAVLEVGHLHTAGVPWPRAWDALGIERIRLIHVKDQVGPRSVPYGTGEIDLPGLLRRVAEKRWNGAIVVEMEVGDQANTEDDLLEAVACLREHGDSVKV